MNQTNNNNVNPALEGELLQLKIKKYFAQYEYLQTELSETEYLFNIYNKKFLEECYGEIQKPKIIIPQPVSEGHSENNSKNESPSEEHSPDHLEDRSEETEDDIQLKKIYRVLSLKTHPDKKNGDKKAFLEVNEAYKEKNILKLIIYASKYNIDIGPFFEKGMNLFEKNISEMKEKIENFKKTLAWHWCHATEEQKQKFKEIHSNGIL